LSISVWTVFFTEVASVELIEAQDWYEQRVPGLGRRFRAEIDKAIERVAENPEQFPVVFSTARRVRAKKFPYSLFFTIEKKSLLVVACFHSKRDPREWQKRV
jgi:plasmid stabilization system protein ParE